MERKQKIRGVEGLLAFYFFISALLVLMCQEIKAQTTTKGQKEYTTWLRVKDKNFDIQGTLCMVTDSTLCLKNPRVTTPGYIKQQVKEIYSANEISKIFIRKKGNVGKGALIGAFLGFGTGMIAGLAAGDDPKDQWISFTAAEKGILLGALFTGIGAVAGTATGSIKIKFSIRSDVQTFETINKKLIKYSLQECMGD